jgi:hypothetical protein
MKNWSEWEAEYQKQRRAFTYERTPRTLVHHDGSYIKAIQLDAFKAGMTRAAELCASEGQNYHRFSETTNMDDKLTYKDREIAVLDLELQILSTRDNIKEI